LLFLLLHALLQLADDVFVAAGVVVLHLLVALDDVHGLLVLFLQLLVLVLVDLVVLLHFPVVALQLDDLRPGQLVLLLTPAHLPHGRAHLVLEVALQELSLPTALLHVVVELALQAGVLESLVQQLVLEQDVLVIFGGDELVVLLDLLAQMDVLLVRLHQVLLVLISLLALCLQDHYHLVHLHRGVLQQLHLLSHALLQELVLLLQPAHQLIVLLLAVVLG
jgi:hypothetical protein